VLFDRQYKLLVGKKGKDKGLEITGLRITFEIEKTAKKNPNKSKIQIWNLQKTTRAEIEKPDTRCLLYAGYKEDVGPLLIFSGNVTYAWTKFDKADVVTEFELGDGAQEIRDTTISVGYNKNIKSGQILKEVSNQMGLGLTLPSNAPERQWQNGLSYYGSARTLLDKVTKGTGLEWSIQNGNLQVIERGMVTTRQGVLLSSDSGMIESPERERTTKDEVKTKTNPKTGKGKGKIQKDFDGWKVKTLLMPQLNPGDRVELDARAIKGVFRIQELKHTGDSYAEGDWQTELKLIDPNAPIAGKTSTKGGRAAKPVDTELMPEDIE
jgi:Baseplate hub gp41